MYCTCGQCLIDSESRRKFNKLRLDALSILNYLIKKRATHGARHGKTEEQKEYHIAWNAWRRCCKKVDSQGGHCTGIHDRFLRDPVYRESQLAIGWTEQKCKELDELAKEDHAYHLTPEKQKIPRTVVSHLEQVRQKWAYETFDPIFELLSLSKIVYTASQSKKLKSLFHQNNTGDGIPLQAHRGGTSLNGIENELKVFFLSDLFVTAGFVYSR